MAFTSVIFYPIMKTKMISAVTCDFPPSLANGSPTATTFSYRISADYKCDPNYILTGNDTLTCLEDAEWSGEIPRCVCKYS